MEKIASKKPSLEDGYIEELELHLRDKIEDFISKGMSEEGVLKKRRNWRSRKNRD